MLEMHYKKLIKSYEKDIEENKDEIYRRRKSIFDIEGEIELLRKEMRQKQAEDTGIPDNDN